MGADRRGQVIDDGLPVARLDGEAVPQDPHVGRQHGTGVCEGLERGGELVAPLPHRGGGVGPCDLGRVLEHLVDVGQQYRGFVDRRVARPLTEVGFVRPVGVRVGWHPVVPLSPFGASS
jgi:hypothetical protein